MSVAQSLLDGAWSSSGATLALLEVARHQLLVDLDDLVDERAVRLLDRREVGIPFGIEEAVDDALAAAAGG
jgi:type II secretory pathway predicted ATPase ExeA